MDLIQGAVENDSDFNPIGFKNQRRNLRTLPQVKNKDNKSIDVTRKAMLPGKRISKTGKVYWETRMNRTDSKGSNI